MKYFIQDKIVKLLPPAKILVLLQSYDNDKTSLRPDFGPKKVVI